MSATNIEPELNSLETKLAEEIANDRKEVDFRQKRITKNESLLRAVRSALGANSASTKANGYSSKSEIIRDAIQQVTKSRFTQNDIEAEMTRAYPEIKIDHERVRSVLWTLANKKNYLVKQVTKGNNRQAAEFEKLAINPNGVKLAASQRTVLTREPETMPEKIVALLTGAPQPMTAKQMTDKYESLGWQAAPNGNLYSTVLQCAYYLSKKGRLLNNRGKYSIPT
jgi:metal-responsive CopG/Arc/MetJ family transcriptional regulator